METLFFEINSIYSFEENYSPDLEFNDYTFTTSESKIRLDIGPKKDDEGKSNSLSITVQISKNNQKLFKLYEKSIDNNINEKDKQSIKEFTKQIITESLFIRNNFMRLFRWRTNINFNLENFKGTNINWSDDEKNWTQIPFSTESSWMLMGSYTYTKKIDNTFFDTEIRPYIKKGEPVYQDLINEAFDLYKNGNLRGAFLLGYTALETGIKMFISTKIPNVEYFVLESPSPNIHALLCNYIFTLDTRLKLEQKHLKLVETYMKLRNKLTHKGTLLKEDNKSVAQKLHLVRMILHRIDFCLGFTKTDKLAKMDEGNIESVGTVKDDV